MSLEWISIVVPLMSVIVFGLIAYANSQAMGRLNDRIDSLQRETTEHKRIDDETFKHHSRLHHWQADCAQNLAMQFAAEGKFVKLPERPER